MELMVTTSQMVMIASYSGPESSWPVLLTTETISLSSFIKSYIKAGDVKSCFHERSIGTAWSAAMFL